MRHLKTKVDKRQLLQAILSGKKQAVKRILKGTEVFFLENDKYFIMDGHNFIETDRRPDINSILWKEEKTYNNE